MIIKSKEISITAKPEQEYYITKENSDAFDNFIKSKIDSEKIVKKGIDEELMESMDEDLSTLVEKFEEKAESTSEIASPGEIIMCSMEEEENRKYESLDLSFQMSNILNDDGVLSDEELAQLANSFLDLEEGEEESGKGSELFDTSVHLDSCNGLRRNYLEKIREAKKVTDDKYGEIYAEGITRVTMEYLTTGVKCITTHTGGTYSAAGVGNSTTIECSAGYTNCFNSIKEYYSGYYKQNNPSYFSIQKEARTISNSFAEMYNSGTLSEIITGIYIQPSDPPYTVPLMESNTDWSIDTSAGKQALYISLLSALEALENLSKSDNKISVYKSLGIGTKYEDTDDVIAAALAAGLKAMIALTKVTTHSFHSNQGGIGFLIPFGT